MPSHSIAPDIAIVIPAWNERENLELLLPALKEMIAGLNLTVEIMVADARSHDGTRAAAERRRARVVIQQERGYGGALLAGFTATTAPYFVTMDANLSHRPTFLEKFWRRERSLALVGPGVELWKSSARRLCRRAHYQFHPRAVGGAAPGRKLRGPGLPVRRIL